jgi:hypothetical protein
MRHSAHGERYHVWPFDVKKDGAQKMAEHVKEGKEVSSRSI